MGTPGQKLSESLEKLKELQDRGVIAIKAGMLSRVHRERLTDSGFICEVDIHKLPAALPVHTGVWGRRKPQIIS